MKYDQRGVPSSHFWVDYLKGVPREKDTPKKEISLAYKDARADYRKAFGERPIPMAMV